MSTQPSTLVAVIDFFPVPDGVSAFHLDLMGFDVRTGTPYAHHVVKRYARFAVRALYCDSERTDACEVTWGFTPSFSLVMADVGQDIAKQLTALAKKMERWEIQWGEPATLGSYVTRLTSAIGVGEMARRTPSGSWELTSNMATMAHWVNAPCRPDPLGLRLPVAARAA